MIEFSLGLVSYNDDYILIDSPRYNVAMEISRSDIHNVEFDDENHVVHFNMDETTAAEYNIQ